MRRVELSFLSIRVWTRWPLLGAGLLTLAYIAWIAAAGADDGYRYAVSQCLYLPVGLVAVAFAALRAWSCRGSRRGLAAWVLTALSLGAFWIGELLWIVAEVRQGGVESPTWADIGYLAYYPLLLSAVVLFSLRSGSRVERFKVGLDVATIFFGGGLLVWYFVLRPALDNLGSGLADAIVVAYPVGDLLLILGIALLAVLRSRFRSGAALVTLLMALGFGFAADLGYGYLDIAGSYESDGAVDAAYLVSWFLFALAAALEYQARDKPEPDPLPDEALRGERTARPRALPYVAIVIALVVLVWALRHSFATTEGGAAVVAVVITILALARQIVAMRENSRLRERQAVEASEERLQHVLRRTQFSVDHAADAMMWVDPAGCIADVNEAACEQLEYSRDELIGRSIYDVDALLAHDSQRMATHRDAMRQQRSLVFETEHRAKSGRVFPVEVTINFLEFAGEQFSCTFARDISERKNAERVLRETEAQLRHAQKMEAIGQLAGGIAHDFNNILTAIAGYCQLLLGSGDGQLGDEARADVEEIKSAADKATTLTRQILTFSRRRPLQTQIVEINDIVLGVERMLKRTLGEHVDFVTVLDPSAGLVEVDAAQLEQAITNLAVNARDAMPQGGRLVIETSSADIDAAFCVRHAALRPGPHAVLTVSDTGAGMDEETKARAFEPFFTTKEAGKGSGLGLATVYGTVKQSRGGIFIHSELGHGTTVKIYLPKAEERNPEEPVPNEDQRQPATLLAAELPAADARCAGAPTTGTPAKGARPRRETVLVVEDEKSIRRLVKRALEARGYQVILVESAEPAMIVLRDPGCTIDILLTDVILPGSIQGGELAQKALLLRPGLPILYMSGYTRDIVLKAGQLQDGMHYLEKPFSTAVLARRVREVIDQSRGLDGNGGEGLEP